MAAFEFKSIIIRKTPGGRIAIGITGNENQDIIYIDCIRALEIANELIKLANGSTKGK